MFNVTITYINKNKKYINIYIIFKYISNKKKPCISSNVKIKTRDSGLTKELDKIPKEFRFPPVFSCGRLKQYNMYIMDRAREIYL